MKYSKNIKSILMIAIGIIIILPILVDILLGVPIPTPIDLGNKEWLSFWGSYLGSTIGGLCTLIAIYFTLKYYEEQDEANKNALKETLNNEYRPLITIYPAGGSGSINKFESVYLMVSNIGKYAATHICLNDRYLACLKTEDEVRFTVNAENGKFPSKITLEMDSIVGVTYSYEGEIVDLDGVKDNDGKITPFSQYYKLTEKVENTNSAEGKEYRDKQSIKKLFSNIVKRCIKDRT